MRSKASLGERLGHYFSRGSQPAPSVQVAAEADAAAAEAAEKGSADAASPSGARFLLFDPSFAPLLQRVDASILQTPPERVPNLLAQLPLDLFALAAAYRPSEYPNLSAWLPEMPSEEVQVEFTGAAGEQVMLEAAAFVGTLAAFAASQGLDLSRARLLDYGLGWGRVSRLLYRFTPAPSVHGVDAWPGSLETAQALGLRGPLALIAEQPQRLPFDGLFDVVCAFSIFTHLSEHAMQAALGAIRGGMREGGLLAVTIRPADIWRLLGGEHEARLEEHGARGFTFRSPGGESASYGDASMTLDYIRKTWRGFEIARVQLNGLDPYQVMVILEAV